MPSSEEHFNSGFRRETCSSKVLLR
ncbi:hypothetical protein Gohar_003468 [Gossypium harknessii]|uniref:Uncharacterized protein n=2 Tax=Gossypium TaxID=3633 RepID=A0A7J9AK56_9ROSI|nr:hypothetical protein [Gossypium laxum]MBA0811588.1 hypothetical protein [Gossypium harknessii]